MIKFDNANDIIVDDDIFTEKELEEIDKKIIVTDCRFPFFRKCATKNIPVMIHNIVDRYSPEIVAKPELFYFFQDILLRFCDKNNIKPNIIYRCSINLSFENSKYKQTHPHIDLYRPGHKIAIMYLNDVASEPNYNATIIYKEGATEQSKDVIEFSELKNLTIETEIFPKRGRIVCFDGLRYHANYFSKGNEFRYVTVFNFS